MAHHIIYIPGLGDHRTYGQNIVIQAWRLFGLQPHYMALGWHQPEGIDAKLERIHQMIETLHQKGHTVSLVGVSAGASAVLNVYAANLRVARVICICGKINRPETISHRIFARNPDFEQSMARLGAALATLDQHRLQHILSIHPWKDRTVPVADTKITGAYEKTVPGRSHASGIFSGIIFGARPIANFVRRGE